jgi:ribosomal protein S18 acetylase RimI-like enzyme
VPTQKGKLSLSIHDAATDGVDGFELSRLLTSAYVGGGFTDPGVARQAFQAEAVRQRGELLCAKDPGTSELIGVVVVVPPSSPARRLAQANEAELHLLATSPAHRGLGIGLALINAAMARAKQQRYQGMVLWTQPSMLAAQRLYERAGFQRVPEQDFSNHGRRFWVYRADL